MFLASNCLDFIFMGPWLRDNADKTVPLAKSVTHRNLGLGSL